MGVIDGVISRVAAASFDPSWDATTLVWAIADNPVLVSGKVSVWTNRILAGANSPSQSTAGSRPTAEATGSLPVLRWLERG